MIIFLVRDRDDPSYNPNSLHWRGMFKTRSVRRKGVIYEIGGEEVELFTKRVMAEAIDRGWETLWRWEKAGKFPKALYKIPSKPKHRFYSSAQIMNAHRIALYRYQFRKASTFDLEAFYRDVNAIWYQPAVVIDEKGELIRENLRKKNK